MHSLSHRSSVFACRLPTCRRRPMPAGIAFFAQHPWLRVCSTLLSVLLCYLAVQGVILIGLWSQLPELHFLIGDASFPLTRAPAAILDLLSAAVYISAWLGTIPHSEVPVLTACGSRTITSYLLNFEATYVSMLVR